MHFPNHLVFVGLKILFKPGNLEADPLVFEHTGISWSDFSPASSFELKRVSPRLGDRYIYPFSSRNATEVK